MNYKIKELTVQTVKNFILGSIWAKSEDNVEESAAFILQVSKTDSSLHLHLSELIEELDRTEEIPEFHVLKPLIIGNLFGIIEVSSNNCAFIYTLYKKEIISKEELKKFISDRFSDLINEFHIYKISKSFLLWFLPEIYELNLYRNINLRDFVDENIVQFVNSYFNSDKIDQYKQMRDLGEPSDILTKSLRNDDVDSLQSFIALNQNNLRLRVPFNIFEDFVPDNSMIIDYSAAYGSIKCFKYLLLNHFAVTKNTFKMAVFGGNAEIIKIVDQQLSSNPKKSNDKIFLFHQKFSQDNNLSQSLNEIIIPSITKHRYDIFDWILENKFTNNNFNYIDEILTISAYNGNAHSIIEIINKGFDINYCQIINGAVHNGFVRLAKLIYDMSLDSDTIISKNDLISSDFAQFGSLSMIKLYLKLVDQKFLNNNKAEFDKSKFNIRKPIEKKMTNVIQYVFDNVVNKIFEINTSFIEMCFDAVVKTKSISLFNYLIEQFKIHCPSEYEKFSFTLNILNNSCIFGTFEVTKQIFDSILADELKFNKKNSYTKAFMNSVVLNKVELCKYFISKNVKIDYEILLTNKNLLNIDNEMFMFIMDAFPNRVKRQLLLMLLKPAIIQSNLFIVDYILKEKDIPHDNALITAINYKDLLMVDLILNNDSRPQFVNKIVFQGTALSIAAEKNETKLVKRLMLVPGINPNLYNSKGNYPLSYALMNLNFEMIDCFLDFYGDDFINQTQQIEKLR